MSAPLTQDAISRRESRVGPVARMTDGELSEKRSKTEMRWEILLAIACLSGLFAVLSLFAYFNSPRVSFLHDLSQVALYAFSALFVVSVAWGVPLGRRLALLDSEDTVRARRFFAAVRRLPDADF